MKQTSIGRDEQMRILHNAQTTTRWLIVSVVCTWLSAGMLAWVLPPQLVVQPELAQDAGDISTSGRRPVADEPMLRSA